MEVVINKKMTKTPKLQEGDFIKINWGVTTKSKDGIYMLTKINGKFYIMNMNGYSTAFGEQGSIGEVIHLLETHAAINNIEYEVFSQEEYIINLEMR